eukprot:1289070-Amphidinium_carterae.1
MPVKSSSVCQADWCGLLAAWFLLTDDACAWMLRSRGRFSGADEQPVAQRRKVAFKSRERCLLSASDG